MSHWRNRYGCLPAFDIRWACDVMHPVFEAHPWSQDGRVSIEVDPRIAHDTDKTTAEAARPCGGWSTGPTS